LFKLFIDTHRGRRGRGVHLIYPLKNFKKLDHKNAIKQTNRETPRFSHSPK
jgi:hypothetical protein